MIKPYYEESGITIFHGDCREILPTLEPVDLVLTDPPYINLNGGFIRDYEGGAVARNSASACVTDPWKADLDWMQAAWDVAVHGMMVFCGFRSVAETRNALPFAKVIALITWYKRNSAPTGKNVPYYTSEFIWAFNKLPGLKWDALKGTVFDIPGLSAGCMATERFVDATGKAIHPTQKPLVLIKQLLAVSPRSVLDPFMGSGTTLRAAKDLGLSCVGIEISEKYCEIAANRLRQEVLNFG